jgi:hypothetical protein
VLELIKKGETSEDHIHGALKVKEAGISCSVYVMRESEEKLSQRITAEKPPVC